MDPKLLKEKQVAEILDVSESWLQKGRVYGYGPHFIKLRHPRGAIRYWKGDVDAHIEQSKRKGGSK